MKLGVYSSRSYKDIANVFDIAFGIVHYEWYHENQLIGNRVSSINVFEISYPKNFPNLQDAFNLYIKLYVEK